MTNAKDERTALVIDDNEKVREVIAGALRAMSFDVVELADGRSAIELLKQGYLPTLVVTDFEMPCMSGLDVLDHVVSAKMSTRLCVVTGSPYLDEKDVMERGARAFLRKPFSPEEFRDTIASMLD